MKCKVGDLAYIKKALRPENVGKIVVCVSSLGYFIQGEDYTWNGEKFMAQDTDYLWVVSANHGLDTLYGNSKQATIPDSWLQPITPPTLTDKVREKELVE